MSEATDKISVTCPACQKLYRVPAASVGKQATCGCGQRFTIQAAPVELPDDADYKVAAPAAPARTATPACKNHPDAPATAACSQCRAFVCSTCDYPQNDGTHLCVDCAGVPRIVTSDSNPYRAPAAPQLARPLDQSCRNHPDSMALALCQRCKTPVCDTCDFVFPGGIHICPTCATDATVKMSGVRKAMLTWSFALAGVISLMMVLLLSGLLQEFVETTAGDIVVTFAMQISGLIGVGLAFGTLDSRAGNPPAVWVSVVWNCLVFGAFLIIMMVGLFAMMGGMV